MPESPTDSEEDEDAIAPAIWHDSDDERLAVSLAGQARLRKLRVTESEDVISGKEYVRRLRRQFQRLHPTPDWANPELTAKRRKADLNDSDAGSEGDDSDEDEHFSAQPLAKLLQNATDLTRIEDNARPGGKRKLRQGVVDIQRLKDVGKAQPVNFPPIDSDEREINEANISLYIVLCRFTYVPPSLSTLAFLWTSLDSLYAPYLSLSTSSEPSPNFATH